MGGRLPASRRTEPLALTCGKGPSRQGGSSPISRPKAKVQGSSGPDTAQAPVHLGLACPAAPLTARQLATEKGDRQGLSSAMGNAGAPVAPKCRLPPSAWGRPRCPGMGVGGQAARYGIGRGGRPRARREPGTRVRHRGMAGLDAGVQALAVAGRALLRRWLLRRCRWSGRMPAPGHRQSGHCSPGERCGGSHGLGVSGRDLDG